MTTADHQKRREILEAFVKCPKCNGQPNVYAGWCDGSEISVHSSGVGGVDVKIECGLCNGVGNLPRIKAMEYILSH